VSGGKPFAEVRPGRLVVGEVTVNYDFGESARIGRERFEEIAAVVNAAAEAREARLRRVLSDAEALLSSAYAAYLATPHAPTDAISGNIGRCLELLRAEADVDASDYVPRAELEAERAKTRQLQAVADALDDPSRYQNGEMLAAWLEANGLKRPESDRFAESSDEALLVELATRGYVGALDERPVELRLTEDEILALRRLEPKVPPYNRALTAAPRLHPIHRGYAGACPHCSDMPYRGRTLACPECGIDRHGVGHGAG
jgi:hypothetical protein